MKLRIWLRNNNKLTILNLQNKNTQELLNKDLLLYLMFNRKNLINKMLMLRQARKRRRRKRRKLLKRRMMSKFCKYNKSWNCSNSKNRSLRGKLNNSNWNNKNQKGKNTNVNNKNQLCNNNVKLKKQKRNYGKSRRNKKNQNVNKLSQKKFNANTSWKRKRKLLSSSREKKRRTTKKKILKRRRKGRLNVTNDRNRLKSRNRVQMTQLVVVNHKLTQTKDLSKKTLASQMMLLSTISQELFLRLH